jgi:branched-chain amino acid transport system permease protein
MNRLKQCLIGVLALIYLVGIPFLFRGDKYVLHVFILCSQLSIVGLTVRLMFISGELTFGQVAFVMFGAYGSAILTMKTGMSFWIAMPCAGLITAFFAALIGFPVLRLKGTYFAMLSLVLAEVIRHAVRSMEFLGGVKGLSNIPRPGAMQIGELTLIPAFSPTDRLPYYFLIAILFVISMTAFWRLDRSSLGAILRGIKQSDELAASLGVHVMKYKIVAYCIGAFFAGIVGSFSAHYMTVFYPESFSVWDSIYYVLYSFIGGIGYLWGPVVGCFGLRWLWEFLYPVEQFQMVIFAAVVIVVVLFLPNGFVSLERHLRPWWRKSTSVFSGGHRNGAAEENDAAAVASEGYAREKTNGSA